MCPHFKNGGIRSMFNFNEFTHFLKNVSNMSSERAERILIEDYFTNKDFAGALFNPSDSDNIAEYVSALYKVTAKPRVMKLFINAVSEYGPEKLDRWVGTYLYSVASFNLDALNASLKKTQDDFDDDKINHNQYKRQNQDADEILEITKKLNKIAGKVVKSEAKIIAKKSGLDKEFVKYALKTNPDPKYINSNRIGYFLNQLLNELYTELDEDKCDEDIRDIDWKYFFRSVYGKENVLDVATFVLLEGAHRTSGFKSQNVRKIWDSLTAYALDTLENADAPSRNQMIELYLKRIEKMFANGSFDLRVDLRTIPTNDFPRLTQALEKYKERLDNAFKTKTTKNA